MSRDGWAALPRDTTGLSVVCDCGISWSYSLTILASFDFWCETRFLLRLINPKYIIYGHVRKFVTLSIIFWKYIYKICLKIIWSNGMCSNFLLLHFSFRFVMRVTSCCLLMPIIEPQHEISNNVVCGSSKASVQPAHMCSLIRAFASRLNIRWVLSYWLNIIWSF